MRVSEVMTCLPKYLGVACVLLVGLPGFAQIGTPERPKPATIEVLVTDPDDRPIPEAEVSWSAAGATPKRLKARPEVLRTDLNGKCSIDLPGGGSFRVVVWREGYLDSDDLSQFEHAEVVDVALGKTVPLFVDLVRSGSFQGTVYLEDGRRVAGATVRLQAASLSPTGTSQGPAPNWLKAKTDAQGNYAFPIVPPSRYGMWIAPPDRVVSESLQKNDREEWTGYATAIWHSSVEELQRIVPVEVSPGEDVRGYNIVLRKTRVYPYQGTLRAWNGEPIVHAKVAIRVGTGEPITLLEPRPVNSKTADFDFPALPEGHYWLLVYVDGARSSPYSIPLEVREGAPGMNQKSRRVVRVPPWVPVFARVVVIRPEHSSVEKTSAPAAGAQAEAALRRSISWFEPGPVQVWLTPAEDKSLARGDTTLNLQSDEANDSNKMNFPQMTLAPGTYRFELQVPEHWYVGSARTGNADLLESGAFVLAEHPYATMPVFIDIEIRQGGTALEGLVVNEKGEPLSNSAMCAIAVEPARRQQPGGAFCVRTDGEGAFRSRWMSPGDWSIWALTRKPRENPFSPVFQEKYERRGKKFTVPENGAVGRRTLVAIE